jgi:uncharacterized protein (DUF1800 family)
MPSATTPGADVKSDVVHLLRRTGYAARPAEVDAAVAAGYRATVDRLMAGLARPAPGAEAVPVPRFAPFQGPKGPAGSAERKQELATLATEARQLMGWWLQRMVASEQPFQEKLAFFWHGHFATAIQKVKLAAYLYGQNQLFRTLGLGPFESLVQAVGKDPAMLIWLDADQDRKGHPNENFARELMELFTLGIGNYTEADVQAGARCFTGWGLNRQTGTFALRPAQHDTGTKTYLGHTGDLSGEDAIHLCCQHPATARHLAARLWSRFAAPIGPDDPVAADLAAAWARDQRGDTLVRAMLLHPRFTSAEVKQGLVKQPVEWVVGALRSLGLAAGDPQVGQATAAVLQALGQVPFNPPSVGGWPAQAGWLTTATQLSRLRYAQLLASKADLSTLAGVAPAARPLAAAGLLGVDVWGDRTTAALARAASEPKALMALALIAPESVLA